MIANIPPTATPFASAYVVNEMNVASVIVVVLAVSSHAF